MLLIIQSLVAIILGLFIVNYLGHMYVRVKHYQARKLVFNALIGAVNIYGPKLQAKLNHMSHERDDN